MGLTRFRGHLNAGDTSTRERSSSATSHQTLGNWVAQDHDHAGRKSALTSEERLRLRDLERENRKLREEREILRKEAAAFFAGEAERS